MTKKNRSPFRAQREAAKIECGMLYGDIELCGADDTKITVERSARSHVKISENDGVIAIKQRKKPRFFRTKIKIFIPAESAPDLFLTVGGGSVLLCDTLYGNMTLRGDDTDVSISRCSFSNADLAGKKLRLECTDVAVANSFDGAAEWGDARMEHILCGKMQLKFKNGAIGITDLDCPDNFFSQERGSLNLILKGGEEDYSTNVLSLHGTCNRENAYGGEKHLKAYSEWGNIVVDFTKKKEGEPYGHDDVAEDTCSARGVE